VLEAPNFVGCPLSGVLEKHQITRHPTAPSNKKMTLNQFYELARMLITISSSSAANVRPRLKQTGNAGADNCLA
jgi:hypothetical protein